ncbi:sensor histidine kinase [Paenibacillus sp. N3.4]|uniref:cache domain-containing sensor histidine kinase n=1 Tax=Paenibacillus sp. N3.4 TaxID=2603222 RepID=UPI0011C78B3F|nr:histidine kinase [Paenibacillus sp. N3.4]TXK84565.1 sensor histidine kinase [Paenibacillus sp. N3.4]
MKIKYKLLLLLLVSTLTPLFISLFITYNTVQKRLKEEFITYHTKEINQLNKSLQLSITDVDNKLMSIYQTSEIYNYVTAPAKDEPDLVEQQSRVKNLLIVLSGSLNNYSDVYLFVRPLHKLYSINAHERSIQSTPVVHEGDYAWISKAEAGDGMMTIFPTAPEPSDRVQPLFFIGRSIPDIIVKKPMAVLGVSMDANFFGDLLSNQYEHERIVVMNADNRPIFSTQKEVDKPENFIEITSEKNMYGWSVITYFPKSILEQTALQTVKSILYWGVLFLLVGIILAMFIALQISKPVAQLVRRMKDVGQGDFSVKEQDTNLSRKDEIGYLANQFDRMVFKIDELIQNEYDLKLSESYAQVKALQAQINPHFLYNTLTSIYSEALDAGATSITTMIKALSSMFRYTIEPGSDVVHLAREIEHIEHYLLIQKYRFEDKLTYSVDIAEHLLHIPTVKLSLQPIVENALIHGVAGKGKGSVHIKAVEEDDEVRIIVIDSGIGLSTDELNQLALHLTNKVNFEQHIGLNNVQQRILHAFPGSTGIQIESEIGQWTKVTISWKGIGHAQGVNCG